jgi:hypothetical protein
MALIMAFAMMMPASLVTYAADSDNVVLQGTEGVQQPQDAQQVQQPEEPPSALQAQEPEAPVTAQDAPQSEVPQAPQEPQQPWQSEEPATLVPLDDPAPTETFAVTITPSPNGTVTADVETAERGATVTLTVTPADGYGLKPGSLKALTDSQQAPRVIRGDGSAANPYTFTMPADSVTVSAEFIRICTITIASDIEHGTVTTDVTTGVAGDLVAITVTPDEGYRLKFNSTTNNPNKSLKATYGDSSATVYIGDYGNVMDDEGNNPYTDLNISATTYFFTMPNGDVTITAEFTKAYAVRASENITNGSLTYYNQQVRTEAGEGERVAVSAAASAGYKVKDGSFVVTDAAGNLLAYNAVYTEFTMPASDVTISVEFEELPKIDDEAIDFKVVTSDSEATYTFNFVESGWVAHNVYYRPKGSDEDYKTSTAWGMIPNQGTGTITGLLNDTEYEFYVQVGTGGPVSGTIYATPRAIVPTQVVLSRSAATVVLGETMSLYAEVSPAASKSKGVTWSSSNEDVATVGEHGVVETKTLGDAVITVTTDVGGKIAACVVSVVDSTPMPSGGSMLLGSTNATYNEDGGTATVPFTVIVPTNRPIFEADFSFAVGTATTAAYSITGISLDGAPLNGGTTTEIDNSKIRISTALPLATTYNYAWGVITPLEGRFLEAGKTYEFTLSIAIKGTAPPVIPINFSNMMNYAASFYYYDYDYSPNRDRYGLPAAQQSGMINATWTGAGAEPPFTENFAGKTYNLSTVEHLLWYAEQINTGAEIASATLYEDIDLTGMAFDGIGTAEHPFASTFNGNGHAVTYSLTQSTDGAVGFVRYVTNGFVTNLTTKGSINVTSGTVNAGGVVGEIKDGSGYVINCTNEVSVTVTGSAGGNVGGVVGYVVSAATLFAGAVGNNTNLGTVVADGTGVQAVGGIAGYVVARKVQANGNGAITRSTGASALGSVTGRGFVGGIVGIFEGASSAEMTDNTNCAAVVGLSGAATGGIAGKVINAQIGGTYNGANRTEYPNRNYGAVSGATTYVAGIVAYLDNVGTERAALNFNAGPITSTSTAGDAVVAGIIGYTTGSATAVITENISNGLITGGTQATKGGVLGKAGATLSEELCAGNWYAVQTGLSDAAFAQTAPANWLSINGWAPQYSGTGGDGSVANPYQIANVFDFLWFAKQVNSGSEPLSSPGMNYNVILVADIDLSGYPAFEGIGTDSYPRQEYHGIFDGNGHTITVAFDGFTTAGQAFGGNMAIFRRCVGATIKNLTVRGSVVGRSVAGVALQFDGGMMENVHNYADVTGTGGSASGILNGSGPELLRNVTNHGTIYGDNAAGIAMTALVSVLIEDCVNYGNVTGRLLAAGVVGSIGAGAKSTDGKASLIIRNTRNEGTVTSLATAVLDNVAWYNNADPSTNHTAGGIVGKVDNAIIELNNVTNNGTVQGSGNNVGGILGTSTFGDYQDTDFRIINSTNNGTVQSTYNGDDPWYLSHINVGGIVGNTSGTFDPSNPSNPYGTPGHTQKGTVTGSTNNGNVIGPDGTNVGSIAGLVSGNPDTVNIGGNYSTVKVDPAGRNPADGTYYDPTTQEVVDGKIVDRYPAGPNPPGGDGTDPSEPQDPDQGTPSVPQGPVTPSTPSTPATGTLSEVGLPSVTADASGTDTGAVIDNRPATVAEAQQPPVREPVVEQPVTESDTPRPGATGTEVSLTPIPLGLGFQSVANTVLTIAVGFVALGIFALGGFVFWRMYRRRIDVK